jgi:hypothetical protein
MFVNPTSQPPIISVISSQGRRGKKINKKSIMTALLNIDTTALAEAENAIRIVKIFREDGPWMSCEVVDMINKDEVMGGLAGPLGAVGEGLPVHGNIIRARTVELYPDQPDNNIFCPRIRRHKKVESQSHGEWNIFSCCSKPTTEQGHYRLQYNSATLRTSEGLVPLVRLQIVTEPTRRVPALILISDEP